MLVALATFQCEKDPTKKVLMELPSEVVDTIEKRINEGVTPSIAIAVIDSSGIHYHNFGITAVDGKAADENTIYEIGSISKAFKAIPLAQQVSEGKLKLDDEINRFLPDDVKVPVMGKLN